VVENRKEQAAEHLKDSLVGALEDFLDAYLEDLDGPGGSEPAGHRARLATAVLIMEIARADFEIGDDERRGLIDAVQHALQLTPDETRQILRSARAQAERPPRLHEYAAVVDRLCTPEQKKRIVESLWRIAFADAELLAHEEYLVRKLAEMLHVDRGDFIEAKINAREAFR
jgi:uncharacterized tellurite resistance protein B-like protein